MGGLLRLLLLALALWLIISSVRRLGSGANIESS